MLPKRKGNRRFGEIGEDFAVSFIRKKGYQIIARNFRSAFGEIDIVALFRDTLVFIEVKTRWSLRFGLPQESVTPPKLFKIRKTAEYFSLLNPKLPKKLRIEVVALEIFEGSVTSARIILVE